MKKIIDIISIGEVLIDFIGHETNASIEKTKNYHRFLGGSPTNVAINAAKLGLKSILVATCGQDGLGDFIVRKLEKNNVLTSQIQRSADYPTSVIFVSKSTNTPEFIAYRQADCQIHITQISEKLLKSAKIYHTTCFALSKNPARNTILEGAKQANSLGLQTSIDINFSEKIWPNREEAKLVLKEYLSTNPIVKLSDDDCFRLFDEAKSEEFIFQYFHKLGAKTICLTKGKDGVVLSDSQTGILRQKALPIKDIKDTTGAGDAFWTGFLYAQLSNKNLEETISIAQKLAVLKLQNLGGLPDEMDFKGYLK
ncbi:MAG: PfkB family carbohydrate kinase [Flavobacterium sp.]|uniref:carbohydrate kinase family protein n=1 Tax=Flavobacterium sp. TaxID=239 RepID=UPI00261BC209|nr:PfkB family carbohydrate kinase [Flavobacterium sp.]MDD5150297.1 PfkB family carbohydrate kinase [Flavobacterium sp.]